MKKIEAIVRTSNIEEVKLQLEQIRLESINIKLLIMKKIFLIVVVVFLISSEYLFSTASTQIWIPSTDFQKWKTMHLGLDNYIRTDKINGIRGAGMFDLGLTTGLLPFEKFQGEIGVDYLSMGDNNYDDYPICLLYTSDAAD